MRLIKSSVIALLAVVLCGCAGRYSSSSSSELSAIQIIDRNGFNETVNNPDRLAMLQKNDFLTAQPYQKVVRTYKKNNEGKNLGKVTTYHENGQPWQYLETVNGRANGEYKEWYQNGNLRMLANVIEGIGDLTPQAQTSWRFDGKSRVWNETGSLIAEIIYEKGLLEEQSVYYHPNGKIAKTIPYRFNRIDGVIEVFNADGELIGTTQYSNGQKNGVALFKGNNHIPPREEEYQDGRLIKGKYWDFSSNIISEIQEGNGKKPIFENGFIKIEHEFKKGLPEGEVKLYKETGVLDSIYHVHEGQKHGEEWCYFDKKTDKDPLQPMLHIHWQNDEVHGMVRTWYENGVLESEKEMAHNKKHGILLAWYEDGNLMIVEEYENDVLVNGKYLKKGEDLPVSRVVEGNGYATLFDPEGNFVRKIEYRKGVPIDS